MSPPGGGAAVPAHARRPLRCGNGGGSGAARGKPGARAGIPGCAAQVGPAAWRGEGQSSLLPRGALYGAEGLSSPPGWPLKREVKVASPQFVLPGTGPGQRCGAVVGDAVTSFPRRSSLSQSVVTTALSQASALGLCSAASCWLCEEWVSSGKYPSRKSCD